ncbi:metallophosphoesterase [Haloarcula brevis]|uniref:metallophosphoesterase n=1 Tax=Haloarcula brevis TaxID=3111453 RepID=UPI00300EA55B
MLAVISDTHGTDAHRLTGRTLDAVREADHVVHAGDFTTERVLDAIDAECDDLTGVVGNNDGPAVRARLPDVATVAWEGLTIVVAHGHEHTETALGLLARQENADVVVVGHSHRPGLDDFGGWTLVNPGSYADPRRYQPAHAEMDVVAGDVRVRLRAPDGTPISTTLVER